MKRTLLLAVVLLLGGGSLLASLERNGEFPHEAHEGLFPVCVGCHVGAESGVAAELFPDPVTCGACHDGVRQESVEWSSPRLRTSNLNFSHVRHQERVEQADIEAACVTCHVPHESTGRMQVVDASAETCLGCHVHDAEAHLSEGRDCTTCHLPLAEAEGLTERRIADFPRPDTHGDPDFIANHAPGTSLAQASCATCHTRDTCVRCHVNAERVDAIVALPLDERVAALEEGRTAEYPLPSSHLALDWAWDHGELALADRARCANCHTRPTCTGCHVGGEGFAGEVIGDLPEPIPSGPPGVDPAPRAVHPPGFATAHGPFAGSGALDCVTCHSQAECAACHAGTASDRFLPPEASSLVAASPPSGGLRSSSPSRAPSGSLTLRDATFLVHVSDRGTPGVEVEMADTGGIPSASPVGYHPPNFMERHATEVFAGTADCQSCHSTEAFCRDCHSELGLASAGRLNTAFHTAQPLWLLAHGEAARLSLESCAACHAQTDCLACHSSIQGRGVSPHGPGFDADRMSARNRVTCQWCHLNP